MVSEGTFYEDDGPVEPLLAALDAGSMQLDDVARDDESEPPSAEFPCEFAVGAVTFNPAPVVALCGKPGRPRRGITWADVYACDECYARWRGRHGEGVK